MKIKTLSTFIAVLAVVFLSSLALARGPVDRLAEELNLSDAQVTTISALFEAHRDAMHAEFGERDRDNRPDAETRERMKQARDALHAEIVAVLDADQAERFEQITEERRGRHRKPGRRGY
ncbi:MAG: hypothetical protein AAF446_02180 [Pseudomonadota bacterium]